MSRVANDNQRSQPGHVARSVVLESPGPSQAPLTLRISGALGVAPFWLLPLIGFASASSRLMAGQALAAYGAIILSFLGGSRLGMTLSADKAAVSTILLAMAPPLLGWTLILVPAMSSGLLFCGLALCLTVHAVWDGYARDVPHWYGRLRWRLTAGAVGGLLAAAAVWRG